MSEKVESRVKAGINKKQSSGKEKFRKEKISIKVKLISSHILISVIPILIIVFALTSMAGNSLMNKVNSSNVAFVSKVTKILDGNINNIEYVTKIIATDSVLNATISKSLDNYKNKF